MKFFRVREVVANRVAVDMQCCATEEIISSRAYEGVGVVSIAGTDQVN